MLMNKVKDRSVTTQIHIGILDMDLEEDVRKAVEPLLEGGDYIVSVEKTKEARVDVLIPFGPTNVRGGTQTFKRDNILAALILHRIKLLF